MKKFWGDLFYNNGYLLIGAAWLFTLSFIFSNYWSYTSSPKGVKKSMEKYVWHNEEDFDHFLRDTSLIRKFTYNEENEEDVINIKNKDYSFFLYTQIDTANYELVFWNTQSILPGEGILMNDSTNYIKPLTNGQYQVIKKRLNIANKNLLALYLLPIRRQYVLESEYLQNGFVSQGNLEENYSLSFSPTEFPIRSKTGDILFYLQPKPFSDAEGYDWITLLLRIAGALLILFFLHNIGIAISKSISPSAGVAFMVILLIGLRFLSYSFHLPANFRQFELFNPRVYGSSFISPSLGDLLINSLIFFWLVIFARVQFHDRGLKLNILGTAWKRVMLIFLSIVLFVTTLICGHIIRSLVADSQISLDVTNFFTLNIYSIFGFIVLCCVTISYFIFSQAILNMMEKMIAKAYYVQIVLVTFIGLLILSLRVNGPYILFELLILVWVLFYVYLMNKIPLNFVRSNFVAGNAMFWLFIFSASIAAIIISQNRTRELELRKRTAEKLVIQTDPSSERLLNIVTQSFTNIFFLNNLDKITNPSKNARFKDSILNAYFEPFTSKYETELFFFNAAEQPLGNGGRLTYDEINSIYSVQGKATKIPELRYYETAFDKFSYVYSREIRDSLKNIRAYFFMLANPKRYRSDALYPELFKQAEDFSFENTPDYAYAIYVDRNLQAYINDYSFPTVLSDENIPKQDFYDRYVNGYSELWYKSGNKVVVITRRSSFIMEAIALFSYLFVGFLILVVIFQVASIIILSGFRIRALRSLTDFNIRSQIYATVIFVSVFALVVVGGTTIVFFTSSYNKNNKDRLSKSIQDISKELKGNISDHRMKDEAIQVYDSAYSRELRQQITNLAQSHDVDVNLYNSDGSLQISSQPFVYNKGVLSRMMEPLALYNLQKLKKIQYIQEESYGKMKYLSIYVPVLGDNRNAVAYLNIPYFNSQNRLKQQIASFLVTIITINAFIFLLAGIIALFLTNRITGSFTLIGAMMRDVNLGKHNAEIVWTKKDEIGVLVKEYNKMVQKLEESAVALAKTEREGAWREMARQVAHEIKNPLTPMKLSIQYLQKAINNNAPNVKDLSANVAQTLVEQIDHLSRIAAEFSQFANIGNAKNEVFDLNTLLSSLVYLHDVQERVSVKLNTGDDPIMINADKTQINRLFTNLLQNAIEAIPEENNGWVTVAKEANGHKVIMSIKDTGTGIPKSARTNIFTPNFTTKTSGTGLGLAICKGIVEQAHGTLWFDTAEGKGTTFYVELPLYDNGIEYSTDF
ncbi:MAG: HAMP domain-containing histidine kinase [Chitinophagaceae bacterium]|nr:HAMP domain-containing histidine kinase [Chitinophagaceae bacterium]